MISPQPQYWAFRIDTRHVPELDQELAEGRLRQGWGWDPRQDLRNMTMDGGARRNRRMREQVKKGDRILIPHLPKYGQITIAEATQDWIEGYTFSIWDGYNDYGHIFPAKRLLNFSRSNTNVPAPVRDTFRNPSRFWNVNDLASGIEHLLSLSDRDLEAASSVVDRWQEKIAEIIRETKLEDRLYEAARRYTSKADWEFLLVSALQRLNPQWQVKRTGGQSEVDHGTDIIATIPDIFGVHNYGIAIQVKDYEGTVGAHPLEQIRKATEYWDERGTKILERVVVLINCDKAQNLDLVHSAASPPTVRIIWGSDVLKLVSRSAGRLISDSDVLAATTPNRNVDVECGATS